jgi:hypothetical protein
MSKSVGEVKWEGRKSPQRKPLFGTKLITKLMKYLTEIIKTILEKLSNTRYFLPSVENKDSLLDPVMSYVNFSTFSRPFCGLSTSILFLNLGPYFSSNPPFRYS